MRDVTNFSVPSKRNCASRAEQKFSQILTGAAKAPRGNPQAAVEAKKAAVQHTARRECGESDEPEYTTLRQIVKHECDALQNGRKCIDTYIERNTEYEIQKLFAIQVFLTCFLTWGLGIMEAVQKAADVTGFSSWSVRKWTSSFLVAIVGVSLDDIDDETITLLLSSERGKHCKNPGSLINDENFRLDTTDMFNAWVKDTYQLDICSETARVWLHKLGFTQKNHHKSVYFDGHEREDVVSYREEFLQKLEELDRRCQYNGHEPQLSDQEKRLIPVHHDESTFYSNADQTFHWGDDEVSVLKQKSLGSAIMVSDFIEEATGDFLRHDGDEARLLHETKTDGYFDSNKFMEQVDHAINVFEKKFPDAQALFLFDNAPSHRKCSDETLNAEHMNVKPGGKQPIMRDTHCSMAISRRWCYLMDSLRR